METMQTSTGTYKVRVIEDKSTLHTLEYAAEPSFSTVVSDVQTALG